MRTKKQEKNFRQKEWKGTLPSTVQTRLSLPKRKREIEEVLLEASKIIQSPDFENTGIEESILERLIKNRDSIIEILNTGKTLKAKILGRTHRKTACTILVKTEAKDIKAIFLGKELS